MQAKRFHSGLTACLMLLSALAAACGDDPLASEDVRTYFDVATGGDHTCAIASDSTAYCWGRGNDGQLGTGGVVHQAYPTAVASNIKFRRITTGDAHTCALDVEGRAYCWGWNAYYQLGITRAADLTVPQAVETNVRFAQISAGAYHTCALSTTQAVYCWGYNRYGQIGIGGTQTVINPELVPGIVGNGITAGGYHSCAVTAGGGAWCWGRNDYGQLGIGSDAVTVLEPNQVRSSVPFAKIEAGLRHTCAVGQNARGYCWGSAEFGEIGDGAPFKAGLPGPTTPAAVSQLVAVGTVSAGAHNTCAIAGQHSYCWGWGAYGQLGVGTTSDHALRQTVYLTPQKPLPFSVIATGGNTHSCGINEGAVYCWGTGEFGQLGAGSDTYSTLPQRVRAQ